MERGQADGLGKITGNDGGRGLGTGGGNGRYEENGTKGGDSGVQLKSVLLGQTTKLLVYFIGC